MNSDRRRNYNDRYKEKLEGTKIMKKLVILLLSLILLTACGSNKTEATTFEEQLIEEKTIIIATSPDYPPFESIDVASGELLGFDIDLMEALVAQLDGYTIEWKQMEFDTIVTAIQTGQVDLGVSGFSYDPKKQVLFTTPYYAAGQTILVKADSGLKTTADLNGKLIAAQLGTTMVDAVEAIEGAELVTGTDNKVLIEGLKTGAYDGVALDLSVALNYANANDDLMLLEENLSKDEYCLIAHSNHQLVIDQMNALLADFVGSDAYNELLAKWGM